MQHFFDIEIAKQYGVDLAIFLCNQSHWIQKNIANRKNFHDGAYWTYNSHPAFLEIFPYWSVQNLKTVIKSGLENGLINIGNYNEKAYDKTNWYSFTEKGLSLFPGLKSAHDKAVSEKNSSIINIGENQPMHKLKLTDGSVRTNRPIPNNKPYINTDTKSICATDVARVCRFDEFWSIYPKKKNKDRSRKIWKRDKLDDIADLILSDLRARILNDSDWKQYKFIPHPSTYLYGKRWEDEITLVSKPQEQETTIERGMRLSSPNASLNGDVKTWNH